eukprot:4542308-Pyramimonas_sp.AAC.1
MAVSSRASSTGSRGGGTGSRGDDTGSRGDGIGSRGDGTGSRVGFVEFSRWVYTASPPAIGSRAGYILPPLPRLVLTL